VKSPPAGWGQLRPVAIFHSSDLQGRGARIGLSGQPQEAIEEAQCGQSREARRLQKHPLRCVVVLCPIVAAGDGLLLHARARSHPQAGRSAMLSQQHGQLRHLGRTRSIHFHRAQNSRLSGIFRGAWAPTATREEAGR